MPTILSSVGVAIAKVVGAPFPNTQFRIVLKHWFWVLEGDSSLVSVSGSIYKMSSSAMERMTILRRSRTS